MRSIRFALLALAAAVTLKAAPAHAGFMAEPYLGYKMGNYDGGTAASKGDLSGVSIGARVGYAFPVIFVAADYSILPSGSVDWDNGGDTDVTNDQLLIDVGVSLPLIRAYAGYGLMNDFKFDGGAKLTGGSLWKLGVGTTILPFVAINLEYQNAEHDKAELGGLEGDTDAKSNAFMLSVSLPLEW